MNWLRIFSTVALAGLLLAIGGAIWLKAPSISKRTLLLPSSSTAKIVLELQQRDAASGDEDDSLHCSSADSNTYAHMMRSMKFNHRLLASLSANDLTRILGANFVSTGKTTFRGLTILKDPNSDSRILVRANHSDPATACFIAQKFLSEFIRFVADLYGDSYREALESLRERKTTLTQRVDRSQAALDEARRGHDQTALSNAEDNARIARALLSNLEARIAAAKPEDFAPPHGFHVINATVTSGPFWNRTTTNFTAEVR